MTLEVRPGDSTQAAGCDSTEQTRESKEEEDGREQE